VLPADDYQNIAGDKVFKHVIPMPIRHDEGACSGAKRP